MSCREVSCRDVSCRVIGNHVAGLSLNEYNLAGAGRVPNPVRQWHEMLSALMLGYTVYYKLRGPRK